MADGDTKLEVLHDHYKDSCELLQNYRKERDRFFVLLAVVLILMLFQVAVPLQADQAISDAVSAKLGIAPKINVSFLCSVIWLALLGLLLRYCQTVITMERQYRYIHALEELLSAQYSGQAFTREGKAYFADYPLLSSWASFFYRGLFPILLIIVASMRIVQELSLSVGITAVLVFDILAYLGVFASVVVYMLSIHRRKKKGADKQAAA